MSMSTSLLRVHDELSKVAKVHAGLDGDIPTVIPADAIAEKTHVIADNFS